MLGLLLNIGMNELIKSSMFLLLLLNPFLVVVYLIDVMQKVSFSSFVLVMTRAGIVSVIVFSLFAVLGDLIFADVIQAEFASFQIFGGIVFLLIGIQFVFNGNSAIEGLRGESAHIAGAIAMPIMIGPGTISASVVAGQRLSPQMAVLSVVAAITVSVGVILCLKKVQDYVLPRNGRLVERYIEVAGRITALFVGTISIEMIMKGIGFWLTKLS
jgi:multiple antibiotic resistance protein